MKAPATCDASYELAQRMVREVPKLCAINTTGPIALAPYSSSPAAQR